MRQEKIVNETYYNAETPDTVIEILERLRKTKERVRIFLGDKISGECWLEEFNVLGTIGRSTGRAKIPLLINLSRSLGGGAILTHCIVMITTAKGAKVIYKHPNFNLPNFSIVENEEKYDVLVNDSIIHASFSNYEKANKYIQFMQGKKNSK